MKEKLFTKKNSFKKLVLTFCFFLIASSAMASHFRHGTISWRVVSGNTVEFKISQAWANYGNWSVGQTGYSDRFYFGDGQQQTFAVVATAVNTAENWYYGETTITHTYANIGNFTAYFASCCKIGQLSNNANAWWRNETIVNVGSGNESPVTTMAPIINMQMGTSNATFQVPASDPDGDNLTYRLATYNEIRGYQPSGISISSTGLITFNTQGRNIGSLWNAAIVVEDGKTKVINDFIIKIVQQSNPPIFDYTATPTNGQVFQVSPGVPVNFTVQANDSDPGATVSLQSIGVPPGAVINLSNQNTSTITASFSWTPTASNLGTNVINFLAQDNVGAQVSTSVTILVSLKPQFDVPPTPAEGVHNVYNPGDVITYNVQASDPDPLDIVSFTDIKGKDMMGMPIALYANASFSNLNGAAANPTNGTFTWATQASDWGHKHVYFYATDSYGDITRHEISQLINTPPTFTSAPITNADVGVPYSYTINVSDADIAYGDEITILANNIPNWLSLSDNGDGTATLSGTPSVSDAGTAAIVIQAEDKNHHQDPRGTINQLFDIEVNDCTVNVSTKNITVSLDDNGNAIIEASAVDNNSSATCGIQTIALSKTSFDCSNVGDNEVILTVTDVNGNSETASAIVTVEDNLAPKSVSVSEQTTTTIPSGATNGWSPWTHTFNLPIPADAEVTGVDMSFRAVDQGWGGTGGYANFVIAGQAIGNAQLFHDERNFTIDYNGSIPNYNNSGNNQLEIFFLGYPGWRAYFRGGSMTISYNVDAQANNITVSLDANGNASINVDDIDPGITDNCGIGERSLDISNFDCSNIGENNIVLTVNDVNGNSSDFSAIVTVLDTTAPVVATTDISIDLDADGNATITPSMIDNGSTDACGIQSIELDTTSFSCSNVGEKMVTLTVTDNNYNVSTATAIVTVNDVTAPEVFTTDIIVELDSDGNASITADMIDNGSTDACGIQSITLDNTSFTCSNLGDNQVTLTVTDNNNNVSTATANVTVNDVIAPTVITQMATVTLANGEASISTFDVDGGTFDNCSFTLALDNTNFTCNDIGENTVTLTATDSSGNTTSETAIVNVVGDIPTISIDTFNAVQTQKENTIFLGFGPQSLNLTTATTGGSGFTYEWTSNTGEIVSSEANPSISPTVSTTYDVTVTNSNGCTASTSIYVCVIDARAFDKKGRYKGKVKVCHHTSGKKGTKHVEISISASAVMTHLTKHGVGTDHADKLGGCNATCVDNTSAKEIVKTEVPTESISDNISVYPVPSQGVFDIKLTLNNLQTDILLFDTNGKLIERKVISAEDSSSNIITIGNYNLSSGIYILKVINQNESYTKKLLVTKN